MIRMLTEGARRTELVWLAELPADLISTPFVRVVPLKGARAGAGTVGASPISPRL